MQRATKRFRVFLHAGFVSLLILGASGSATIATAQSTGTFTATGDMTTPRSFHTATLLPDGTVLIAGGFVPSANHLASAEIYDPSSGTFTATGNMAVPRTLHAAILLGNGKVLIVGQAEGRQGQSCSAELYDPSTRTFAATGNLAENHCQSTTATLLRDGKVLIAGGSYFTHAELYDPATGAFSTTGTDLGDGRGPAGCFRSNATLLSDGRVLFAGGSVAQLYDPDTGTFSPTGDRITHRAGGAAATLLTNGKVLVAGGALEDEYEGWDYGCSKGIGDAELYEPATGTFTATGKMTGHLDSPTATLLPDGTVLIAGRNGPEIYYPSTGTFTSANLNTSRSGQTATLLMDGKVLIAGGDISVVHGLPTAVLYTPPLLVPAPVLFSLSGDGQEQGAILHAGTDQVASADNPATAGEALEIYCTGLGDGSVIPPQVAIGGQMAEVLFFGKAPGFAGGNQLNVRVPSGVAPGPSVPVRLTYIGRPSNEVTIGVR